MMNPHQALRLKVRMAIYRMRCVAKPIASGPGFTAPGRVILGHRSRRPVEQGAQACGRDKCATPDLAFDKRAVVHFLV